MSKNRLDGYLPTYKIAIVGAGPAGYFTAQALQNAQNEKHLFAIDMIERLPTPWGLVRSGVAPDHQKVKTVSKVFEKIARAPNFRLFANVELGRDISLKGLKEQYDAVILATGASKGRKLGIPGEDLANSLSAADFVPWYNSHPNYVDLNVDLSCDTAVVIGAGNVAIDVARILAIDPKELYPTDIADHALRKLKQSNIKTVFICGRRGPEHATFTAPELRDLSKLANTIVSVDEIQIQKALDRVGATSDIEKNLRNNLEVMRLLNAKSKNTAKKKLKIKFLATPVEIKGAKRVEEVVFTINSVKDGKAISTSETFSIKTGLVISAIGYDSVEYPGISIINGRIHNIAGHVTNNIYTTGWAKRGPTGVIGNNKSDSSDVVDLIISNLKEAKVSEGITALLKSGHKVINQTGWEKINASEVVSGEILGKPRVKEINLNQLINLGTN